MILDGEIQVLSTKQRGAVPLSNKSGVDNEYVMNLTHKKTILLPLFQPENRQAI